MKATDIFHKVHILHELYEFEALMEQRNERGENAFWLSHDDHLYPTLLILVKSNQATLHYFSAEESAGFISVGGTESCSAETLTFAISNSPADNVLISNNAIVSTSTALLAACNFFLRKELPSSIEWLEL